MKPDPHTYYLVTACHGITHKHRSFSTIDDAIEFARHITTEDPRLAISVSVTHVGKATSSQIDRMKK